ncbi:MAG: 1-aminocyclopropane-1-carboxylate deaminase/D-cysteine desulfhydrase [Chitinophagales bacterium]|nr:1-aminocyclopropane-1-carboxylate deaminase/D-cysteine desulfhydrase [Chitinophagales bacterium]
MTDIFHLPTRLDRITNALTEQFNVSLFLKRDDLIHPEISGNKWRKLKYNIEQAKREHKDTLLTFGGAFSNHITATAAAGKYLGFKTIGIIRGEEYQPLNKSLQFAKDCGMKLMYLDRENYKLKNTDALLTTHDSRLLSEAYIIPEGGANELAVKGCSEIVDEIDIDFDYICCACGTGTTIAGMATNLKPHQKAIGFAVLKHPNLVNEINERFLTHNSKLIIQNYPFGGYAKTTPELIEFIKEFYQEHQILLDYVYTGKLMYGIFDLISKNYFPENTTIISVHTGGVTNANVFDIV